MADDVQFVSLRAPTMDRDVGQHANLTDEVLDVRSRTSVDLGRILTRQHGDSGPCHHRQFGADDQVDPDRASRPGRNRPGVVVAWPPAPSSPKPYLNRVAPLTPPL